MQKSSQELSREFRPLTKRSLKIAVFSYGLPVLGEKRGGIEQVAHLLAEGLARRGHQVTVWSYDPKPEGARYQTRILPGRGFFKTWLGQRLTMGYLGNFLALLPKYGEVDVIIAHGDSLFLPFLGKPIVRIMHGSALGEALSSTTPWRFVSQSGIYLQEILTTLSGVQCVAISYQTLRHHPFIRRVIPHGVDGSVFTSDSTHKTSQPSILFVGSLGGRKRGNLLIQWFTHSVRVHYPEATLSMVSEEGPKREGVTYYTGIDVLELAKLYREAWIFASPSIYEGFGLPYLEAMASGTPVIATPNPGSREVLGGGQYGLLVKDSKFPEALVELLGDDLKRSKLAAQGLERARQYSLENMISRYEELLREIGSQNLEIPKNV